MSAKKRVWLILSKLNFYLTLEIKRQLLLVENSTIFYVCNCLIFCKKLANLQNFKYLLQYQVRKQKMWKTKSARNIINYTFLNKKILKLNLYSRKTENVLVLFKGVCAKIYAKFLRKNCTICLFLFKAFQRLVKI